MRLLITGFEPFEGAATNTTKLVVRHIERLAGRPGIHPALERAIGTAILPVADRTAAAALHEAIDRYAPEVVIALGEAAARTAVGIERLAINLRDYRIPDNEGVTVTERPIVPGGPAAYFATLPLQPVRLAFEARKIPARLSRDAGTFLCNQVMYELLHRAGSEGGAPWEDESAGPMVAGFIHLPLVAEQLPEIAAGRRSMPRPGPGVLDGNASDGSALEPTTRHWHQTLSRTAVPLEVMALGVLDAAEAACRKQ